MSSITDVEVVHSPPRHLGEALAALDHGVAQARAGEIAQILAIAAACDLYDVDRTVLLKGVRAGVRRRLGRNADDRGGIPRPRTGGRGCGSALGGRVADRLRAQSATSAPPHLWARVIAGHVAPWQARIVTDRARDLSREDCAVIDEPAAAALIGLSWGGRAQREVDRLILLADPPHLAMRKIEDAAAFREVRVSRIDRGHVDVWARLGGPPTASPWTPRWTGLPTHSRRETGVRSGSVGPVGWACWHAMRSALRRCPSNYHWGRPKPSITSGPR